MDKGELKFKLFIAGLWLLLLSPIFVVMYSCDRNKEDRSAKYDGAYWRSIEREKQFKDAGLDEYAKRERRERRKKLRSQ